MAGNRSIRSSAARRRSVSCSPSWEWATDVCRSTQIETSFLQKLHLINYQFVGCGGDFRLTNTTRNSSYNVPKKRKSHNFKSMVCKLLNLNSKRFAACTGETYTEHHAVAPYLQAKLGPLGEIRVHTRIQNETVSFLQLHVGQFNVLVRLIISLFCTKPA